jgi:hypothetical protein
MPYKKTYENYDIEVVPNRDKFDVRFTIKGGTPNTLEQYDTEREATIGATNFPKFYELALNHGYSIIGNEFQHANGKSVGITNAMDLDRTGPWFEQLLITGE